MDLYKINGNKLSSINKDEFKLEKEIQSLVENNLEELFDLEFVSSEFTVGDFRLDTLCFDNESNSFVIIEYKKGTSYSVIDQGYSYLSIMLNNKSDFILEYNETKNKSLKRDDLDWSQSRIIFISQSFNAHQKNSVNFKNLPFELWEVKKFSNNTISLNEHLSNSKENIDKIGVKSNKIISQVNNQVKVFSEEDTLNGKKVSQKIRSLYYELKEKLSDWEDFNISCKKNYISFKRNKKVFVFLNFRKNYIRVHLLSYLKTKWDGTREKVSPKNKFILDDPKKMFDIWENDYKVLYAYDLKENNNLDYFSFMLKQKFDQLK